MATPGSFIPVNTIRRARVRIRPFVPTRDATRSIDYAPTIIGVTHRHIAITAAATRHTVASISTCAAIRHYNRREFADKPN